MNAIVLSLYLGYAIYETFPFRDDIIKMGGSAAMGSIIAIILYAIAAAMSHYVIRRLGISGHMRRGLPAVILWLLVIGFLLTLAYQVFAITRVLPTLPLLLSQVFGPSDYFFWWFIAPLAGLFFLA